jgi:putative sigma-54 modulation protein
VVPNQEIGQGGSVRIMNTEITTRHFELSDGLKKRTEDRLNKLHRFFDRIMDARVVVSFEKNRYDAEATLIANGTPITSHAKGDSEKVALEQALDKLEVQVRRHKDRLTKKKRRVRGEPAVLSPAEPPPEEVSVEGPEAFEEDDLDSLVREEPGEWTVRMSVAEAVAQLRVSRRESLAFTNVQTSLPTLVFKRRDGNVGVVSIEI